MNNQNLNTICSIYELKGKQELYSNTYLKILDRMAKSAKIQSTKASYDILNNRLKDLIEKSIKPKNTNEKEIRGYHIAFDNIVNNYEKIEFNEKNLILINNTIFFNKDIKVKNMDNIFKMYRNSIKNNENPLIFIPKIIFEFIKLNPFEDGNGRIARLIILLLLFKNGFFIGKYISISYLIEKNKKKYKSSINKKDNISFIEFFLNLIHQAYTLINNRFLDITNENLSSTEKILKQIIKQIKPISKSEIMTLCPDISQRTIERALKNLQDNLKIIKIGNGKNTKYILKERENHEKKY